MSSRTVLFTLCLLSMSTCSKLNSPQPGMYRADIELSGSEIPMQLRIDKRNSTLQLWVVDGELSAPATDLQINGDRLQATLPNDLGILKVRFDQDGLQGELQLVGPHGAISFPVTAKRNENYRFIKQPLTDNADISGNWRLQLASSSMLMSLTQARDVVDGHLQQQTMSCDVIGQMHNDDIHLAAFCKAQLWLFKGHVNAQDELEGDVWQNHEPVQHWRARRSDEAVKSQNDNQPVSLP